MYKSLLLMMLLLVVSIFGCSKKNDHAEETYKIEEFTAIIDSVGVTPDKETKRAINFADYAPGVNRVNSKALIYERLHFYALEFETEKQAQEEAKRLNQYYSRNWLFDKVEGEPILEDLVIVKFHAKNPSKIIPRKPVHIPTSKAHDTKEGSSSGGH